MYRYIHIQHSMQMLQLHNNAYLFADVVIVVFVQNFSYVDVL